MVCLGRFVGVAIVGSVMVMPTLAHAVTAPEPVNEGWSGTDGWLPLAAAASGTPRESWQRDLSGDATYAVQSAVVVVAEPSLRSPVTRAAPSGGRTTVRRIDTATGDDDWRSEVDGTDEVQLAVDAAGSIVVAAAEAPDGSRVVTILEADTGQPIWEADGFDAIPFVQPFAPLVIVSTPAQSVAVNAADGATVWRVDAPITVFPGSLVFHAEAAAGSDTSFGLIDPATGEPLWELERPPGAIATALGDIVMLSHDEDGQEDSLIGFDRATGAQRWTTTVPLIGNSGAWPLGLDGALYGGNNDPDLEGRLVAIDLATGSIRWTRPYHKPGGLTMWRSDGRQLLLSRTSGGTLQVIDAGSGSIEVSSGDAPAGWPSFASGKLYFQDPAFGVVTALDMASLQPAWTLDLGLDRDVLGAVDGGLVTAERDATGSVALAGHLG